MQFLCPHCQKKLTVQDQYADKVIKCPSCSETFQAPPANTSAPPAKPVGPAHVKDPAVAGPPANTSAPPAEPPADSPNRIAADKLAKAIKTDTPLGKEFSNCIIEGDLDLDELRYSHKLVIEKSVFRGRFQASDARFACTVDLSDCTFEQGLVLEGARIEGGLCLNGATIHPYPGEESAARRRAALRLGPVPEGYIELLLINVFAANLRQVRLDRNLVAQKITVAGHLDLGMAKIGGQVRFDGARIRGDLILQEAEIEAGLVCMTEEGQRTAIEGNAWLPGAKVAGQILFTGAWIGGDLNLQNTAIGGDLFCEADGKGQRTVIHGNANLNGARVASMVNFSGAQIGGEMSLQTTSIGGALDCRGRDEQLTEIGAATFRHARIGEALLDGRCFAKMILDLSLAEFTKLTITEALPKQTYTEGLRFQELSLPNDDYVGLLEASKTFQKSTYRFTENWLRNRGEDRAANKVYLAMRRRERREGRSGFTLLWDLFLDGTVGYGLRSYRLGVFWLLPVLVLTVVLFSSSRSVNRSVVVTATEAANAHTDIDPNRYPASWTPLDAFWVAVRINVPLVNLGVKNDWSPSSAAIIPWLPWITYEAYAGFVALTSWITVPLFLAAFSGILKKEK